MALTPLHDARVAPPEGATVELRYKLTGGGITAWSAPPVSTPLDFPYTPDSDIWLTNGLYEWRYMVENVEASDWRAFRAYAGYGAEGLYSDSLVTTVPMDDPMPANGSPATLDTITVPDFGVENFVGTIALSVDFAFNHMTDLDLILAGPDPDSQFAVFVGSNLGGADYALDANVHFQAAGDNRYAAPMIDAGVYSGIPDLRGFQAGGGVWSLKWQEGDTPTAIEPRTGLVRSWRIEYIPD